MSEGTSPSPGPIYGEIASIGSAIERVYGAAVSRPECLDLLARSIGAALSRVDGRRRELETAPDFMAPAKRVYRVIVTTSSSGQSLYDLAESSPLGYHLSCAGKPLRYHASPDAAVLAAREDHAANYGCDLAAVRGAL